MAYSATAPNVDNYFIGKGVVKFKPDGTSEFVHLGNCPEVEWTPNLDVLDHFSSMVGIRAKDRKVVREKSATVRIVMEELTPDNLGLALMGGVTDPTAPATEPFTIDIYSLTEIKGALRFIGQNDIGPKVQYDWPLVSIIPSGSINLISDEWASMEITADVLVDVDTGKFGTATWGITAEVTTP
jgi:hypothetical protein